MRYSVAAAALTLVAGVLAEDIAIQVGKDGKNTFEPNTVTPKQGDFLVFTFVTKNHSVVQSTFDEPCKPKASGIDSGFKDASASPVEFRIQVNDTNPAWYFCSQTPHCEKGGMVLAVNPPADKTFQAFQAKATAGASNGTNTTGSNTAAPGPNATNPAGAGGGKNGVAVGAAVNVAGLISAVAFAFGLAL